MNLFKSITPGRKEILIHILTVIPLVLAIIYSSWRLYAWDDSFIDAYDVVGSSMSNLGMILCALMMIILWSDTYATRSTKFFRSLTYEIFFLLFFNTMYYMDIIEIKDIDMQSLVVCIRSAIVVVILLTFWLYIQDITKSRKGTSPVIERLMFLLMLGQIALLVINFFTEIFYSVDDDGLIIPTNLYLISAVCNTCMMVLCLYEIMTKISSLRKIVAMSVFLFFPIFGKIIDLFLDIGLRYVSFATALFIIYCNLYVWRVDEITEVEGEIKAQSTEALMSQIKPHFLYNSLTSIMNIPGTPMDTKDVIADFGKYLRGNIDSLVYTAPIPFRREMDFTELFLEMQKLEYGDKLNFKLDLKVQDFMLPVMTLRTLAALCIKYGIAPQGYGTISISTKESDTAYDIRVADDGVGYTNAELEQSLIDNTDILGYETVKRGLGDMMNATISYYSVKGDGTAFNIRVPKVPKVPEVPAYLRQRGSQ